MSFVQVFDVVRQKLTPTCLFWEIPVLSMLSVIMSECLKNEVYWLLQGDMDVLHNVCEIYD